MAKTGNKTLKILPRKFGHFRDKNIIQNNKEIREIGMILNFVHQYYP